MTGEALHWDEVGFAVPWHISEVLRGRRARRRVRLHVRRPQDRSRPRPRSSARSTRCTSRSSPIVLGLFIGWHYLLIRFKGISAPFWLRASGRTAGFSEHIRGWLDLQRDHPGSRPPASRSSSRATSGTAPAAAPVLATVRRRARTGRPRLQADLPDQLDARDEHLRGREARHRSRTSGARSSGWR